MIHLTDKDITRYFHRSFSAVDGLWFMKIEEKYGFDTALDIDREVWKIIPKIQARMLQKLSTQKKGMEALFEAIETKLTLEDYTFDIEKNAEGTQFIVSIRECPWYNLMDKSDRKHLAKKVGETICTVEFATWASEFSDTIQFELVQLLCGGANRCVLKFTQDKQ